MSPEAESVDTYVAEVTRAWVERFVIGLNLCPFARRPVDDGRLQIVVTPYRDPADVLSALERTLASLQADPALETVLLVHPQAGQAFDAYLDLLALAEDLIALRGERGIFQLASFHPDYVFAESTPEDAANFTNRAPYPMLHVLRESSIAAALGAYPDPEVIPERNVQRLRSLGSQALVQRWEGCFEHLGSA